MSDYFDRVERQLVQQAGALYSPSAGRSLTVDRPARDHRARRTTGLFSGVVVDRGVLGRHDRRSRRGAAWWLAGAGLGGLGGIVAAVIVSFGAGTATSELNVTRGKGHLVTITAAKASSIAVLNSRLASLGIPIRAAKVTPDCVAPVQTIDPHQRSATARTLGLASMPVISRRAKGDRGALLSVMVAAPTRPGRTLVLAAGGPRTETVGQVIAGRAPVCIRGVHHESALLGAAG